MNKLNKFLTIKLQSISLFNLAIHNLWLVIQGWCLLIQDPCNRIQ
ncbi:MAG: hypothetical protein BAJALOKI2v1_120019 [Promethearchaeota archaeon]|nr:MAG: hypothetical protein BAJALOKI2v1_120019 [Candidatus Lokiarchaeota archaeon]